MESHQLFGYSGTGAGLSYSSSYQISPSIPNRLFGSFKFDIGNSPSSPFSNHFDCDTITTMSDSREQYSTTDNLSGASPSCNSSLESGNHFHQLSPTLLQDANSSQNVKYTLLQLETALMAPDDEDITMSDTSLGESSRPQTSGQTTRAWSQDHHGSCVIQPRQRPSVVSGQRQSDEGALIEEHQKQMEEAKFQSIPPGNLKQLLIACAKALAENNINDFDKLIGKARIAVSIGGEPIQRLGAYLVEGLVARKELSGNNIYRALRCREPESNDLLSYMRILYEICPYLKFGYMTANGAIAEACKNDERIHIIDFQIAQGTQWITLLQALAAKPDGAPHVRITGIDDPVNKHARGDGLEAVHRRLAAISEKFNIPIYRVSWCASFCS